MSISLKIQYQDEIRRVSLSSKETTGTAESSGTPWKELQEIISRIFSIQPSTFLVKYTDEDGDLITINSDLELSNLISQHPQQNLSHLRLKVFTRNSTPTPSAPSTTSAAAKPTPIPATTNTNTSNNLASRSDSITDRTLSQPLLDLNSVSYPPKSTQVKEESRNESSNLKERSVSQDFIPVNLAPTEKGKKREFTNRGNEIEIHLTKDSSDFQAEKEKTNENKEKDEEQEQKEDEQDEDKKEDKKEEEEGATLEEILGGFQKLREDIEQIFNEHPEIETRMNELNEQLQNHLIKQFEERRKKWFEFKQREHQIRLEKLKEYQSRFAACHPRSHPHPSYYQHPSPASASASASASTSTSTSTSTQSSASPFSNFNFNFNGGCNNRNQSIPTSFPQGSQRYFFTSAPSPSPSRPDFQQGRFPSHFEPRSGSGFGSGSGPGPVPQEYQRGGIIESKLKSLEEMGFIDRELNLTLLRKNLGDLHDTLDELHSLTSSPFF